MHIYLRVTHQPVGSGRLRANCKLLLDLVYCRRLRQTAARMSAQKSLLVFEINFCKLYKQFVL